MFFWWLFLAGVVGYTYAALRVVLRLLCLEAPA